MFKLSWTLLIGVIGLLLVGIIAYLFYQKFQIDRRFAFYENELNKLRMISAGCDAGGDKQGSCRLTGESSHDESSPNQENMNALQGGQSEHMENHGEFERILEELEPEDSVIASLEDSEIMDDMEELSHELEEDASESIHADTEELSKQIKLMDRQLEKDMTSHHSVLSSKMIRSEEHRRNILDSLNTKRSELDALQSTSHQDVNSELKRLVEKKVNVFSKKDKEKDTVVSDKDSIQQYANPIDKIPYKIKFLKDLCTQHGISAYGTKQQLLGRLQEHNIKIDTSSPALSHL